jgi:competence ComEA-like helix-hairpin-helix protein
MKKIKHWIRRYFSFSQRQTNGFLLLLLLTVLAIAAPFLYNKFTAPKAYNPLRDQQSLDSLVAILDQETTSENYASNYTKPATRANAPAPIKLHRLNPNTATLEELMAVGISKYAANNIIKYRAKAGGFRTKEQLGRIYGLPPELYQRLYPYLNLPAQADLVDQKPNSGETALYKPGERPAYPKAKPFRLQPFDLNTADTTQLKQIRGIGSKLSARIVKFRERLGGFARPEQLTEVYGLAPDVIDSLQKYTFVPPGYEPQQLPVNTATLEELRAHPYIGFNLARLIVAYRTQHGPFQSLQDLKNIKTITETQFQQLQPYLRL